MQWAAPAAGDPAFIWRPAHFAFDPGRSGCIAHEVEESHPPTSHRTLLVVDDQESVRLTLEFVLGSSGYRVLGAASGPEALALAGQTAIDGVLIDVNMPGWDGFETCRRLQAQTRDAGRSLRVWFITGMVGTSVQRRAAELGALGVLTKPFHCAAFTAQVDAGFASTAAAMNSTQVPQGQSEAPATA